MIGRRRNIGATSSPRHRCISVGGTQVFYREAGPPDAPTLLLLHGFPSSSLQFRHLLWTLADRWRLVAPDLPGLAFRQDLPDATIEYFDGTSRRRPLVHLTECEASNEGNGFAVEDLMSTRRYAIVEAPSALG